MCEKRGPDCLPLLPSASDARCSSTSTSSTLIHRLEVSFRLFRVRIKDDGLASGGFDNNTRVTVSITKRMLLCKLPAFFGFGTTTTTTLTLGLLLLLLVSGPVVHAYPVWHDFNSRNSVYSFITGPTILLAGVKFGVPCYLTTPLPSGTNHYCLFVRCAYTPCNPPIIHLTRGSSRLDR